MREQDQGIEFQVWGCRGSRSLVPGRSAIGNNTSCYSLRVGPDVLVFDGGRGIAALSSAISTDPALAGIRAVHVFITHSHLDHWEGLKDADWFWRKVTGLKVRIYGPEEAQRAIQSSHSPPRYVPLEVLALGSGAELQMSALKAGEPVLGECWRVDTFALNHWSGEGETRRPLDTLGFCASVDSGPAVAYLSDHFPDASTRELEADVIGRTQLAVFDAQFDTIANQAYGHGSQEHAANVAREAPSALVFAGHHGPSYSDDDLRAAHKKHGAKAPNFRLAIEGERYRWDAARSEFRLVSEP